VHTYLGDVYGVDKKLDAVVVKLWSDILPLHQRRYRNVDHVVLMNKRKVLHQQLDQEVLVMPEEKKIKKKDKSNDDESHKCSCGCGQDITPRKTPYWDIDGDVEEKKEVFGEGCREDENRVANAQRELHSRMSEGDRDKALKWVSYYRALLQEDYDRT
jgi:hypothetical protein